MAYWRTEEVHQTCLRLLKSGWLGHLLPMYFLFLYFVSRVKNLRAEERIHTFMKVHIPISFESGSAQG